MNPHNFFAELKRRNVIRMAGLYLLGAWLLTQVASTVFPAFDVPGWALRGLIITLVLGFIPAMIFSWVFELTPEGLKRDEDVAPEQSIAPQTGRRMDRMIIAVLVVALGYFGFDKFVLAPRRNAAESHPAGPTSEPAVGGNSKSIAVLPFDNLSEDKSNAYFAEGVQDEILTRLAKVADLKVISRTSTQHFKSAPDNLPQIARQLGVANILEGSVQRSNDQVRVNVQLINALTDAHLWADIYDRKLTDIFAVESDIAKTIADTLQVKLTGSEKLLLAKSPTENPEAYKLYLQGRFFWNKRTVGDFRTAISFFERAVALDPNYAAAHAGLAQTYLLIPVFGGGSPREFFPKAMTVARRAIALDEASAEGHATLAMLLLFDFKFAESEQEFRRAIALNPNYATGHHWFGNSLLVTLGRFDEAIKEGERGVDLDPLSLIINADLGSTLLIARRYDEAIAQLQRTLQLDPKFAYARWNLGEALYFKGDIPAAIHEYEQAAALDDDPQIIALMVVAQAAAGHREKAMDFLERLKHLGRDHYVRNYLFTISYAAVGDKATALDYLEKARDGGETPDITWVKVDPIFDPLRSEPRFQKLIAKLFPANAR